MLALDKFGPTRKFGALPELHHRYPATPSQKIWPVSDKSTENIKIITWLLKIPSDTNLSPVFLKTHWGLKNRAIPAEKNLPRLRKIVLKTKKRTRPDQKLGKESENPGPIYKNLVRSGQIETLWPSLRKSFEIPKNLQRDIMNFFSILKITPELKNNYQKIAAKTKKKSSPNKKNLAILLKVKLET